MLANQMKKFSLQFMLACIGITFIGSIPYLFVSTGNGNMVFDVLGYVMGIKEIAFQLIHINEIMYNTGGDFRPLFPFIFKPFLYSITILFATLALSLIVSAVLTFFTMLLSKKVLQKVKFLLFIFESLPDLLIIVVLQLTIIKIYQKTGLLLFSIASLPDEKAYALPIICLSVLPMIQFYKIMILVFEEELDKNYVELAKGKGLKASWILLVHVLRNAIIQLFYHSKSIIWFMLSNLLILEYLFNILGITRFLFDYMTPPIFTVGLYILFIPLFFIYAVGELLVSRFAKEGAAI
jgi:peptide/nickel transport system permease protein